AVDDQGAGAAELAEDLGDHLPLRRVGHAHDLEFGAHRGEQRAEDVEDGGDLQGLAHRLRVGDGRVVGGGEEEGEVGRLELADRAVRVEVQRNVEGLEYVGGTGLGGHGAVAVLDHLQSSGCGDQGGAGGDVYGVGAV